MNPLVFMPPFAGADQLQQAREHAAMLQEEWRLANWQNPGPRPDRGPGAFTRVRRAAGRALVGIGSRLASSPAGGRPVRTAQRTGC